MTNVYLCLPSQLEINPVNLLKRKFEQTMDYPFFYSYQVPKKKQKRARFSYTTEQLNILEAEFQKKPYIQTEERKILAHELNVPDKAIKVWFQNRRMKEKKTDIDEQPNNPQLYVPPMYNQHHASIALMWPNVNIPNDAPKVLIQMRDDMHPTTSNTPDPTNPTEAKNITECETIPEYPDILFQLFDDFLVKQNLRMASPFTQNEMAPRASGSSTKDENNTSMDPTVIEFYKQYDKYRQKIAKANENTASAALKFPMYIIAEMPIEMSEHVKKQQLSSVNNIRRNETTSSRAPASPIDIHNYKPPAELSTEVYNQHHNHTKQQIVQVDPVPGNETATAASESPMNPTDSKFSVEFATHSTEKQKVDQAPSFYFKNETSSVALRSPKDMEKYRCSGEFSIHLFKQFMANKTVREINSLQKNKSASAAESSMQRNLETAVGAQSPNEIISQNLSRSIMQPLTKIRSETPLNHEGEMPLNLTKYSARATVPLASQSLVRHQSPQPPDLAVCDRPPGQPSASGRIQLPTVERGKLLVSGGNRPPMFNDGQPLITDHGQASTSNGGRRLMTNRVQPLMFHDSQASVSVSGQSSVFINAKPSNCNFNQPQNVGRMTLDDKTLRKATQDLPVVSTDVSVTLAGKQIKSAEMATEGTSHNKGSILYKYLCPKSSQAVQQVTPLHHNITNPVVKEESADSPPPNDQLN